MRHSHALLIVAAVLLLPFAPVLLSGEVIFPHDNSVEVGFAPATDSHGSRNFSDLSSSTIPELQHHLRSNREGWIATWNPHVELGRPSWHINGLSKVYFLTRLISLASDDAFVVYTWLTLVTVLLTGLFGYLLLRDFELHPAACLTGSLGLAMGVFTAYWLSFLMFVSALCWTLALLWLIRRFLRHASGVSFAGIVFSIHALLLSGFPQQILWHGLLVSGFSVALLLGAEGALGSKLRATLQLAAAAALGLASVAPVFLDFAANIGESGRVGPNALALLGTGPLDSTPDAELLFFAQWIDASWFGNVLRGELPVRFRGVVLTPLFAVLLAASFGDRQIRALWPWQLYAAIFLSLNVSSSAYLALGDAGLIFSRSVSPLAAAVIPVMVIGAFSANHLIRAGSAPRVMVWILALLPVPVMAAACEASSKLVPGSVMIGLALYAGSLAFVYTRNAWLLVALAVATCFQYSYPLFLLRGQDEIHRSSELVELIARETTDGSRYAWVFDDLDRGSLLPANQEILLGLKSVHGYSSMASWRYRSWSERNRQLGHAGGRRYRAIASPEVFRGSDLRSAGIGALLSLESLSPRLATLVGEVGDVRVYEPRVAPVRQGLFYRYSVDPDLGAEIEGSLAGRGRTAERILDRDDHLRFRLTPGKGTRLLVVSQQFHPQWRATSKGVALQTLAVNAFYQGVLVPASSTELDLRFLPHVRFSWMAPAFFAAVSLGLMGARVLRRRGHS